MQQCLLQKNVNHHMKDYLIQKIQCMDNNDKFCAQSIDEIIELWFQTEKINLISIILVFILYQMFAISSKIWKVQYSSQDCTHHSIYKFQNFSSLFVYINILIKKYIVYIIRSLYSWYKKRSICWKIISHASSSQKLRYQSLKFW